MRPVVSSETHSVDDGEIAGFATLIVQLVTAARLEGSAIGSGATAQAMAGLAAETDRIRKRVLRRVIRLELLANMGGIEPSDVRGALVGIWRN